MKIALAGEGAFGVRHLEALAAIEDVELDRLVAGDPAATQAIAAQFGIARWTTDLDEVLGRADIAVVILATPTPLHASQAVRLLEADKPVEVEIPLADNLADAERVVKPRREPASWRWPATPAGSTPRTSGSTGGSATAR